MTRTPRLRLVDATPKADSGIGPDRLRADLRAALERMQAPIVTLRRQGRHEDAVWLSNLLTIYRQAAAEILKKGTR